MPSTHACKDILSKYLSTYVHASYTRIGIFVTACVWYKVFIGPEG